MPRSGTTLLSSMLDAHPDIALSPETHFYTRCRPTSNDREEALDEVWHCVQQQPGFRDMAFEEEELDRIQQQVERLDAPTPPDVLRAIETTYAKRFGAEAWGEKTPDHLAHVPEIFQDFPDGRVLAIVRDPRDVCLSLADMPWSRDSLPESAWKWAKYARATDEYRAAYPDRFREVRYEELLERPEEEIRGVLSWINAPFDDAVLSFHRVGDGPMDTDREPWKQKVHRPLDPGNKEKWRDQMDRGPRVLVEWIAGDALSLKGYDRSAWALDPALLVALVREGVRAGWAVVRRLWRTWRMPDRSTDDHTPVWMRQREVLGDEGD